METADAGAGHKEIVSKVVFPYIGAASALRNRARHLSNTIFALKQHIYTLWKVRDISLKGHQTARKHQIPMAPANW